MEANDLIETNPTAQIVAIQENNWEASGSRKKRKKGKYLDCLRN
jgi:hypothetical protein